MNEYSKHRKEIAQLRAERNRHREGAKQLNALVGAILAEVAVKFGEKTDTGYTVELGAPDMAGKYTVTTVKEDGKYRITAVHNE